jgi:hypothetical protein
MLGKPDLALPDHDRAVALAPHVGLVYQGRGSTRRCLDNVQGALEDMARAIELDPTWGVQCNLWIWEMRMLRGLPGDREAAQVALEEAHQAAQDAREKMYVDVCRGLMRAEDLLATSTTDSDRCFSCYYSGARALVEGLEADARQLFQQCVDTNRVEKDEYAMAKWHLRRLSESPASMEPQSGP